RAFFQRRIDIAAGNLLWHATELLQHPARETADTHLETFKIVDRIDFLPEPSAHLATRVADKQRVHVIFLVKLVEHFFAAAERVPTLIQTLIGTKGHRGAEGECRILAEIIVRRRVADLDISG